MKETRRRIPTTAAAFAVSAVMLLSSAAAAFAESTSASSEEEKTIVGAYTAEYDLQEVLGPQMEESGITLEGELPVTFKMDLKEDETFVIEMDVEAFIEMMEAVFTEQGPDIIRGMLEQQGITEETFAEVADQLGAGSYDEFIQSMTDEMVAQMGEGLAQSMEAEISVSGAYTADDKEIVLTGKKVKVPEIDTLTDSEAAEASSEETAAESEAAVSASGEDTQADSAASETEENEELKGKIAEDGSIELEFPLDDENTMKLVFKK